MVVDTLGDLIATLGSIDNDEIDWQNIRQATVLIQQTFRYDYPGPITDLRQRLMVVPPDYHGHQRLATHKLRVSGSNLESERSYDSFGNVVLDLTLEEVDEHVEFVTWARRRGRPAARRRREPRRPRHRPPLRGAVAPHASPTISCARWPTSCAPRARPVSTWRISSAPACTTTSSYEWGVTTSRRPPPRPGCARARRVPGLRPLHDRRSAAAAACRRATSRATCSATAARTPGSRCCCRIRAAIVRAVPFDPTHDRRAGPRYVTVAVGRDYGDVAADLGDVRRAGTRAS